MAQQITKEQAEKEYSEILQVVKNTDYVNECLLGAKQGYENEEERAEALLLDFKKIESGLKKNELVENFNELLNDCNPELTKEEFLFPKGDESFIYNKQLNALKFAAGCVNARNTFENTMNECEETYNDRQKVLNKMFASRVYIKGGQNSAKNLKALEKAYPKYSSDTYENTLNNGGFFGDGDYEAVKKDCENLKSVGIKACVANKMYSNILESTLEQKRNNIKRRCESLKNGGETPKRKHKIEGKQIGIAIGIFLGIMAIFGMFSGIVITAISVVGGIMLIIIPASGVTLIYLAAVLIPAVIDKRRYNQMSELCSALKELYDKYLKEILYEFNSRNDYYNIFGEVDGKVISDLYDKCVKSQKSVCAANKSIQVTCRKYIAAANAAIAFLPGKLNLNLLPDIVEIMEEGSASDYKSALRLATK